MSEISLEVEGVDDFIGQETPSLEQAMRDPTASGLQPEHTSDLPGWVLPLNRFVDHSAQPPFQIKDYPFFRTRMARSMGCLPQPHPLKTAFVTAFSHICIPTVTDKRRTLHEFMTGLSFLRGSVWYVTHHWSIGSTFLP
jgi:hypothetical protein